MKKLLFNTFIAWIPLSISICCLSGIIYLVAQQIIRISANTLPVQYAADTKDKLENGIPPSQAVDGIPKTDLQKSLAPFIIIYKGNGGVQASSTTLHGYYPIPPPGIFDVAKQKGENRITWEPAKGNRYAADVLPYTINGMEGFVLAGASLAECEKLDHLVFILVVSGFLVSLVVTFAVQFILKMIASWAKTQAKAT